MRVGILAAPEANLLTLAQFAILVSLVVYVSVFAFYGEQIFDTGWEVGNPCTGFFDCLFDDIAHILDTIGDLLQFITLTNLPEVDLFMELFLKFLVGLPWLLVVLGLVRGSPAS